MMGVAACEREEPAPEKVNFVFAPPRTLAIPHHPLPPDPDCAPDRAGRFSTGGNRWGRYANLCIDRIMLTFEAFPDPSLGYAIQSDRCPAAGLFSRFRQPADFFERRVPEQIGLLRAAIADDLREFARICGISLDPAPFVDDRLDRFYLDYGDGWWFDRLEGKIRLTPNG
jgi:hypothetical protein